MGLISWIKRLFNNKGTSANTATCTYCNLHDETYRVSVTKVGQRGRPPKGYVIYTREGGRLNCRAQKDVAETLAALYSLPINREHVSNALMRYNGRIAYMGEYIATITYKKEK